MNENILNIISNKMCLSFLQPYHIIVLTTISSHSPILPYNYFYSLKLWATDDIV